MAARKKKKTTGKAARPSAGKARRKPTSKKGAAGATGIVYSDVRREALIRRLLR